MKHIVMLLLLLIAPFVVNAQTKAKPFCYVEILFSDVVEEKECSQMRKILATDCQDVLVFAEEQMVYCAIKTKTDLVTFDARIAKKNWSICDLPYSHSLLVYPIQYWAMCISGVFP
jgi:hypothetical protein